MNLDWNVVWENRGLFLEGALVTVLLALASMALGIIGGLGLALARLSRHRVVSIPVALLVDVVRSTPVIMQIYWAYYVVPILTGLRLDALETGIITLAINVSAYNCEIFRAGIVSIRKGQWQAAMALGMGKARVLFEIILPQAIHRVIPALANIWVALFKNTSLVSTIAVADLTYVALTLRVETFRVLEILTAMAVLYWIMGYPQAKFADWLHKKFKVEE